MEIGKCVSSKNQAGAGRKEQPFMLTFTFTGGAVGCPDAFVEGAGRTL